MKRLINLSAILVLLSVFTTTAFAQDDIKPNNEAKMVQAQKMVKVQTENWVDADGDGICDNAGTDMQGQGNGKGYGKKDGTGNGAKPQDGTGFGKMNGAGNGSGTGSGAADGTGNGAQRRAGRK